MKTVVKLDGLIKKYDNKAVVDGLSLEIKEGEIFGLLGLNGARKSKGMGKCRTLHLALRHQGKGTEISN